MNLPWLPIDREADMQRRNIILLGLTVLLAVVVADVDASTSPISIRRPEPLPRASDGSDKLSASPDRGKPLPTPAGAGAPGNVTYQLVADLVPAAAPEGTGGPWALRASIGEPATGTLTGGTWTLHLGFWPIFLQTTGVPVAASPAVNRFSLEQNRPNPFNPSTQIRFTVPDAGGPVQIRLALYDLRGRLVRVLVDDLRRPGSYDLTWDGRDDAGHPLPSGVYFGHLEANGLAATTRLVLVK